MEVFFAVMGAFSPWSWIFLGVFVLVFILRIIAAAGSAATSRDDHPTNRPRNEVKLSDVARQQISSLGINPRSKR